VISPKYLPDFHGTKNHTPAEDGITAFRPDVGNVLHPELETGFWK
jgi:hypothetical protein